MSDNLLRLYPATGETCPLRGLYLKQRINQLGKPGKPFVYANFLTSLDGRIALQNSASGRPYLPKKLTSENDFRLFLELHAQADCLITHSGYMRALADGKLGNILQIGQHTVATDLTAWREAAGLKPQPDIVVASKSLNFTIDQSIAKHQQKLYIATGAKTPSQHIEEWRTEGVETLICGKNRAAEGESLITQLANRGYRGIYLIAGPQMLDTMIRQRQLSRFYQTISHQLLGGENFHTLLPGEELDERSRLQLVSLYLDQSSPSKIGQLFAQFDIDYF